MQTLPYPYSFAIAGVLRTKAQVICSRSKENVDQCFSIFYDINMSTKSKPDSEFSGITFREIRKIRQAGNKYFILVRARFSEKSI